MTGYTEAEFRSPNVPHDANYIQPCQIAAEINVRIKMIPDPKPLIYWYVYENRQLSMAEEYDARKMLKYISGWRRAVNSYEEYKKTRRKFPPREDDLVDNLLSTLK